MTTSTAITKAIVSPLPRNFSESQFLQWLDPLPKHDYFWYYQPSSQSFSELLHSFVCINFESIEDMLSFSTYLSTKELPTDCLLDFKSRPECKIAINQMICTDRRRSRKDKSEDNTGESTAAFSKDNIFRCDELSNNSNSDLECDEVFKEYLEFIDVRDNELINTSDDDLGNGDDDECSVDELDGEDIDEEDDDIEGNKEDGSSDEAESNDGRDGNKNRKKHNASADESEPRSDNESSDDAMTGTNRIQTATNTDTTAIAAAKMALEEDFADTETKLTKLLESFAATSSTDNRIRPRSSSLQHGKIAYSSSLYVPTYMTESMDAIHKLTKHFSSQTLSSADHLAGSAGRVKLRQPIIASTTKTSMIVDNVDQRKNDLMVNSYDDMYFQHTSEEKINCHQLTDYKERKSDAAEISSIVNTNNDDNPKQYADDDESPTKTFNENEDGYQSSTSLSSYSPPMVPADTKSTARRRPKWSQPYQPPKIRRSVNTLQTSSIPENDYDRRPYSSRNDRKLLLYSKDNDSNNINGSGSDFGEHTKKQHESRHYKDNDILSNNDSQQNQELIQQDDVKFRKSSLYTTANQRNTWNDSSVSNNFSSCAERGQQQTFVSRSGAERRHYEPKYESTRYYSSRFEASKYDNGGNSSKYDYIPQHRQRRDDFRNESFKFDNGRYDQRRTSRYFDDYHHQGESRRSRREPSNSGNYYPRGSSNDSPPKKTTFNKNLTSSMTVAGTVSEACRQSIFNDGCDEDKDVAVNQENNRSFIESQSFEEHPRRRRRQPHHQYTSNKYELNEENRTIAGSATGNGISNIRYDNRRHYPSSLSRTSSKFAMNDEGKYYNSKQKSKFETTTAMTSNTIGRKQYYDKYQQPSTTLKQHLRFEEGSNNNDDDNCDDGVTIRKHIFDKRFKTKYETNDRIVNGDSNASDINSNNTRSFVIDRNSLRHQNDHNQSYHRKDNDNYHQKHMNNRSYEFNQDVRSQSRGRNDGGDDHHNNDMIENHIKDVLGMQHQKSQRPIATNRRKPTNNSSSYHRQHNNYYRDDDYNRRNDNADQTYAVNNVRSPLSSLSSSRHLISDSNHSSGMMSTTGSGNIRRGNGGNGSVFPVRDASNAQKSNRNKVVRSYWGPTDDWD